MDSVNNSVRSTYPKQIGIKPLPLNWGHVDPNQRGPVVVSRATSTIRRRNGMSCHTPLRKATNLPEFCSYRRSVSVLQSFGQPPLTTDCSQPMVVPIQYTTRWH